MKKITLIVVVLAICFACKKNKLGGDCVIEGTIKHHSKIIKNASVFIKFKATDQPGGDTTVYDAKVRVDSLGYFKFSTYKGHYYIYGYGYDYSIAAPYTVTGGQSLKLRSKETASISLYVTEGD